VREGLQQGIQQGKEEGFQDGRRISSQNILLRVLRRRFGELPLDVVAALQNLPAEQLEELVDVAFNVPNRESFAEVVKRLSHSAPQAIPA
jgi:flagellar biosynthesis/type III secretory pathway protein FliH